MANTRPGKNGAPLTVGALRKLIEGLPAKAIVMCNDDGAIFTADSASVCWFLSTNNELEGVCPDDRRLNNSHNSIYHELKVPLVVVNFVSPSERKS
jgi:hypothetical protein